MAQRALGMARRQVPDVVQDKALRAVVVVGLIYVNQIRSRVDAERSRDERAAPGVGALHLESVRHLLTHRHLKTVELIALQSRQRRILGAYAQLRHAEDYVR